MRLSQATCHPERRRRAKGLCNSCYVLNYINSHPDYKEQQRQYQREWKRNWRKLNPDKQQAIYAKLRNHPKKHERGRENWLKGKYGLDQAVFNSMSAAQGGKCFICVETPKGPLCVDHDHETGQVRKLLCTHCNIFIGYLEKNRHLIPNIEAYLKEHNSKCK